ncbi:MAG TPA: hypothetical protein VF202_00930 [Trueperaceae bacterium]|jgi:hypothetical protein
MSGLAVYSVVYPAALGFFADFWRGLAAQLDGASAVYLSLHGVTPDDLERSAGGRVEATFIPAAESATPAEVRSRALAAVCAAHDAVVLLDSDDVPLPGRLAAAREGLEEADVYACAMRLIDERGEPLGGGREFTLGEEEQAALAEGELLARVNAFGFSNSAYRAETLASALPVPPDTVLMDWLVVSRASLAGAEIAFDHEPHMAYRQYGANTARVVPPFEPERIVADARRVVRHHELLAAPESASPYRRAASKARAFLAWLEEDERNAVTYSRRLAESPRDVFLWWQHVDAVPAGDGAIGEWYPS